VHALRSIWLEFGIDKVIESQLRSKRRKQPLELARFAMVADRCLEPYSKLHCFESDRRAASFQWLEARVGRRRLRSGPDKVTHAGPSQGSASEGQMPVPSSRVEVAEQQHDSR
jgi:hypothetical protein